MKKELRGVRRRIHVTRFVHGLLLGLLVGLAGCLGLTAASFFWPIASIWQYLVILAGGCPLLFGLIALLWPVPTLTAARRADACGLKERSVTALALAGEDTPMARLQRADAKARLEALPVRQAMPIRTRKREWLPTVLMAAITLVLLVVPNPQTDVLRDREIVRQQLRAQAEAVEEAAEKMAENEQLTEEERRELRRITGEMADALREADDKREALEKLDEKQKEIERLQRKVDERSSKSLSKALGEQNDLESLAKAMESGSEAEVKEAMDALAEMMESEEGREALAEQLAEAAKNLDGASKEALEAAAEAIAAGNAQQAMQALASASGMMSSASSAGNTGANIGALMQMARSGAAQAGSSGAGGNAAGTGTGSGQSRAGFGTTQRDMGYRPGLSQSSQQANMAGHMDRVGEYEQIYDPTRLGGTADPSLVQGEKHEGESQQLQLGPGAGNFSGSVPYNEVIGEYQEAASQAMQRVALPATLQDWVERYFNALID